MKVIFVNNSGNIPEVRQRSSGKWMWLRIILLRLYILCDQIMFFYQSIRRDMQQLTAPNQPSNPASPTLKYRNHLLRKKSRPASGECADSIDIKTYIKS